MYFQLGVVIDLKEKVARTNLASPITVSRNSSPYLSESLFLYLSIQTPRTLDLKSSFTPVEVHSTVDSL